MELIYNDDFTKAIPIEDLFFKDGCVNIYGEINDKLAIEVINKIKYLNGQNISSIKLEIYSPGGSLQAGMLMIDAIKRCKKEVICNIYFAASMAAVISLVCDKRYMSDNATLMFHDVSLASPFMKFRDFDNYKNLLESEREKLFKLINDHIPEVNRQEFFEQFLSKDYYLSFEEATKIGLCDGLIEY